MRKTFRMKARSIPMDSSWDVIVAGGGPSGCTAAAAAAREGARTLLIEGTSTLGGMGTSGLVPAWCPFSDQEKIIYRGLAEKVFNACKAGMPHIRKDDLDWVAIDPELLKRIYDDLVVSAGVTVLFQTMLCGVEMKRDAVDAIITSSKAGLRAYRAAVYVDCTGDADVAAWAGAPFQKGDAKTGELQPATLCFILSNVDTYAYEHGGRLRNSDPRCPIYKVLRSGKYPLIADNHLCNSLIGPGTVGFNAGHVWEVDNTDPASVSAGLVQGRKIAKELRDALAEYAPATFGNAFLAATAPLLGVRETRRIVGDYVLTESDYMARRTFPDEVCRNSYYIDIHFSRKETALYQRRKLDLERRSAFYGRGESHGIPYRCLTPKGLRNVLVAGRSISCDRTVQGSIRVMPACLAMGEAAGLAAALVAAQSGGDVHRADVARLRKRLREEGAYLP